MLWLALASRKMPVSNCRHYDCYCVRSRGQRQAPRSSALTVLRFSRSQTYPCANPLPRLTSIVHWHIAAYLHTAAICIAFIAKIASKINAWPVSKWHLTHIVLKYETASNTWICTAMNLFPNVSIPTLHLGYFPKWIPRYPNLYSTGFLGRPHQYPCLSQRIHCFRYRYHHLHHFCRPYDGPHIFSEIGVVWGCKFLIRILFLHFWHVFLLHDVVVDVGVRAILTFHAIEFLLNPLETHPWFINVLIQYVFQHLQVILDRRNIRIALPRKRDGRVHTKEPIEERNRGQPHPIRGVQCVAVSNQQLTGHPRALL